MDNSIQNRALTGQIRFVIARYKENFPQVDEQERYKWEAIGWYQRHWKIDAEDFADMLKTAFAKTSNLLASGMYYPLRMLLLYAQQEPETVRRLFIMLHDERLDLEYRYVAFRESFEGFLAEFRRRNPDRKSAKQHYQDLRAILVYLTCQYPEKYYFYKYTMFKTFAKRVGFVDDTPGTPSQIGRVESYQRLCRIVEQEVLKDQQLRDMSAGRLGEECYQDEAYHLLTMDLIFYGSAYLSEEDFQEYVPAEEEGYWPTPEEYDPGISKEMWLGVLRDGQITTFDTLEMLRQLLELGGESTCAHLAQVYGKTDGHYNSLGRHLGEKVKARYGCPDCPDREGDTTERNRVYVIPFVGRYVTEDGKKRYSWKLRRELKEALECMKYADNPKQPDAAKTDIGLNTILYGPPGTGKTYHTAIYAVAIIENKRLEAVEKEAYADVLARYNRYKAQGRIAFTTFHQSYGYEEFIEGIRPQADRNGSGDIRYAVEPGIFKAFCEETEIAAAGRDDDWGIRENPVIWKVSLQGTGPNPIRSDCLKNGHIRIGWSCYGSELTDRMEYTAGGRSILNAFINDMQIGDVVLSCYSENEIDAIGVIADEYEWVDTYADDYKRRRKVNWLVKDIRENIRQLNGGKKLTLSTVYRLNQMALSDVLEIVRKYRPQQQIDTGNRVFIIDEINRGNISRIFGELITLIEGSKRLGRAEGMKVVLPYSRKLFGVPENVYILGTMNTADRSIAAIDTALRRRFQFREMLPDPNVLDGIFVEDLSVKELLAGLNRRIEVLYDREHTIGHGCFEPLRQTPTIECLGEIFKNSILPLLQEYFYEDYEKIRLVLADNQKDSEKDQFVLVRKEDCRELFGKTDWDFDDAGRYEINQEAFDNIEAYRAI